MLSRGASNAHHLVHEGLLDGLNARVLGDLDARGVELSSGACGGAIGHAKWLAVEDLKEHLRYAGGECPHDHERDRATEASAGAR